MKIWIPSFVALLSICSTGSLASDAPLPVTKLCMNCHSVDGNSESPMFPRLAGQQADYIEHQLHAYKEQSRTNAAAKNYMWGMARTLSDDDIKEVATWYSSQPPAAPVAAATPKDKQLGETIFQNGIPDKGVPACVACHGAHAEGTNIAPRLAGQHATYIENQLHVLSTEGRPAATLMQPVARNLSAAEMDALAHYLQSLN